MTLRVAADLALLYLAVAAAVLGAPEAGVSAEGALPVWFLPPLTVSVLALRGGYRSPLEVRLLDWIANVVGAISLAAMTVIAIDSITALGSPGVGLPVRAWLFGTLYVAGGRAVLGLLQRRANANRLVGKPTLIVGAGRIGAQVERCLRVHPELGLIPVGYLDADPAPGEIVPGRRAPLLGAPSELPQVAEETGAKQVIFAFLSVPDHVLVPLVRECERRRLEISLVPRLFDSINARVELQHIGGLPLYGLRGVNPRGWPFAVKHFLGRTIAGLLLVVLSPLLVLVAGGVRLTSPGPILFRQRRIGRDGHEFELLKFRSMRPSETGTVAVGERASRMSASRPGPSASGSSEADRHVGPGGVEGTERLTPIGRLIRRTSVDELPQLWNVVKGDMTLVGPRPERPEFVEAFGQVIRRYDDRHRVKSGVTGWAQVHGLRGRTSLADRVEWDNFYIENWSLWLDFKILLMTLLTPFHRAD